MGKVNSAGYKSRGAVDGNGPPRSKNKLWLWGTRKGRGQWGKGKTAHALPPLVPEEKKDRVYIRCSSLGVDGGVFRKEILDSIESSLWELKLKG